MSLRIAVSFISLCSVFNLFGIQQRPLCPPNYEQGHGAHESQMVPGYNKTSRIFLAMTGGNGSSMNNLYLHGLTVSGRFDF